MISTSISAAAAEAHINDLLADADRHRRARLARQANAGRHVHRRRRLGLRPNGVSVSWPVSLASVRSLLKTHPTGRIPRPAAISPLGDGDA